MSDPYPDQISALARWSLIQALWPPALVAAISIAHSLVAPEAYGSSLAIVARLAAIAGAGAVLAVSAILFFDALLFRLMASYEDEQKGGAAVDDILARMRLKPVPPQTRSLANRAAGTRRLVRLQRVALTVFIVALGLPLLAVAA
ncbi:hypothetical protein [Mesorhizobium sp. CN2-181]|uniref:hypothetical protein n=1 Tax=Mesorhizobium yinganensis TaxID=3157707 RepID=UPI0032B7B8A4